MQMVVYAVYVYLVIGLVFSIYFLAKGIYLLDKGAIGSSIVFKLLIWPGVISLWPFLVFKLKSKQNAS